MKRKLDKEDSDDGKAKKKQKIDDECKLLSLDDYIEKVLKFELRNESEQFIKVLKGVIEDYGGRHSDKCHLTVGRNLRSLQGPVNGKDLIRITSKAIIGYNEFDGEKTSKIVVDFLGEDCEYYIAREGSVAIYVRSKKKLEDSDLVELRKNDNIEECGIIGEFEVNFWEESLRRWEKNFLESKKKGGPSTFDYLPRNLEDYLVVFRSLVGCVRLWWD